MRLIGFDPGLRHTGWGVIEAEGLADGAPEPGAAAGLVWMAPTE